MQELRENPPGTGVPTAAVLAVVAGLSREVHPNAGWMADVSLASSLERDLGLDSLARLELLTRLQTAFGDRVDSERVVLADSVGDLVRAVGDSGGDSNASPLRAAAAGLFEVGPRSELSSVPEILGRLVERDPQYVCIHLVGGRGEVEEITVGELLRGARQVAAGLGHRIDSGEPVAVMLPTGREFIEALFGIQMAGGVPVPLAPAPRPSQLEDHLSRQASILRHCGAGMVIAAREVAALARMLRLKAGSVRRVMRVDQLRDSGAGLVPWRALGEEPALLQYTSGSTGTSKGVVLSHANLIANLEAIARALETGPRDVFVSWLPLYHDMGLIGGLLHPLYCGIPLVLMSPLAFLARPELWIRTIDQFRGTMTVAPNFAYEICQRRAGESELPPMDLSCWRLALNGAEPVSPATIDRFCARFGPSGFRRRAMLPVYGLAENSLAVTFPALDVGPKVDRVRRESLLSRGIAEPADETEEGLAFVSCGRPIHRVELRLIDEAGREVEEREVGRVQFRGPSATSGYYRDEKSTRELLDGDWIDSGDLGYLAEGDLYLTGRSKDIIIHAGRNISPHALEEAAGDIDGIRKGCVAVFGLADASLGTERLIVVAETRLRESRRQELIAGINEAATRVVGVAPDDVCLVAPHALLKTSSGKIRRTACRELYVTGELAGGSRRAVWRQMLSAVTAAAGVATQRAWRSVPAALYSAYLWVLAAVLLTFVWLGALVLPRRSRRLALARWACRLFFRCARVPVEVSGLDNLPQASSPEGGLVLVSNHASYLDSMILMAAIPIPLSFVAKRAFERYAVTRILMRRLGATFVDPKGTGDPREEIDRWAENVERGEAMAVFAEGTFGRSPGLRAFKLGAFEVAVRAHRPVVPVALGGSRELLRDEQWWFRRGPLRVTVSSPISPSGTDFAAAVELRDAARRQILRSLDEPDLEWGRGPVGTAADEPNQMGGETMVEGVR